MSMCGWLEDNRGLTIITHMCAYLSSLSSIFPRVFSFNQPHNKPVKKELAPCEAVVQIQALLLPGYAVLGQSFHLYEFCCEAEMKSEI